MRIDEVLVYVDVDADSQRLIEKVDALSGNGASKIDLFTCAFDKFVDSKKGRQNVVNEHMEKLETLASSIESRHGSIAVDATWSDDVEESILGATEKLRPDLVVKQTHDQSVLERILFTNEDWNLILNCPRPLLLTKTRPLPEHPVVMAAVDPMHDHDKPAALDRRILDVATALCERTGGALHAVHVVDTAASQIAASALVEPQAIPVVTPAAAASKTGEEIRRSLTRSARHALSDLLDAAPGTIQSHLLEGAVAPELVQCASELNADFVAMGSVSRGMLENAIIGNTAKRVLNNLSCDLIIVK